MIQIILIHRKAREACFLDHFSDLIPIFIYPNGINICAVRHAVGCGEVVKLKHILDHLTLSLLDRAFFLAHIDQLPDFILRQLIAVFIRIDARQPHQRAVNGIAEPRQRQKNAVGGRSHSAEPADALFGITLGQLAGQQGSQSKQRKSKDRHDQQNRDPDTPRITQKAQPAGFSKRAGHRQSQPPGTEPGGQKACKRKTSPQA